MKNTLVKLKESIILSDIFLVKHQGINKMTKKFYDLQFLNPFNNMDIKSLDLDKKIV